MSDDDFDVSAGGPAMSELEVAETMGGVMAVRFTRWITWREAAGIVEKLIDEKALSGSNAEMVLLDGLHARFLELADSDRRIVASYGGRRG